MELRWWFPIIIKPATGLLSLQMLTSCFGSGDDAFDPILHGSITYPFVEEKPLGINRQKEKFIIRSIVGNSEYVVEIPGAGEDYDIEVPLASLESQAVGGPDRPKDLANPIATDQELVKSFPDPITNNQNKTALIDKAFGVGPQGGVKSSPSYTLGLAKITNLYKSKQFEYALIEINNLLSFFPTSPRLYKMKGTIFLKLGNLELAEKAWLKALELTPNDSPLRQTLGRLQQKLSQTNKKAPE